MARTSAEFAAPLWIERGSVSIIAGVEDAMPIYEYRCEDCRKTVSILTLRVSERVDECCPRCGGRKLHRLLSRFAMPRSEEARLDALADPSRLGDLDENDPKSMARWMKRMGRELGDELGGEDVDQMVEELEAGAAGEDEGGDDGGAEPGDL